MSIIGKNFNTLNFFNTNQLGDTLTKSNKTNDYTEAENNNSITVDTAKLWGNFSKPVTYSEREIKELMKKPMSQLTDEENSAIAQYLYNMDSKKQNNSDPTQMLD